MKQKTAIRQLIEEIEFVIHLWGDPKKEMDGLHALKGLLEKSKELESVNEHQIIDAYNMGQNGIGGTGQGYLNRNYEKMDN